jgi:hypothetical protein
MCIVARWIHEYLLIIIDITIVDISRITTSIVENQMIPSIELFMNKIAMKTNATTLYVARIQPWFNIDIYS